MTGLPEAIILVGASGFIGRNVAAALTGRVGTLVGVNRSGAPVPGCDPVVPLERINELPSLPAETIVINVAAHRYNAACFRHDQSLIFAENTSIVGLVYWFCAERGVKEVRQASSLAVYPAGTDLLDDEVLIDLNRPPHAGEAAYGWSRRLLEVAADLHRDLYGISTQTFRLTNPYGPFDTLDPSAAHVTTAFVIRALSDSPTFEIAGNPDAERDFIFSGDVAAIFVESCRRHGRHTIYNLAGGETVAIRAVADAILEAAGTRKPIVVTGMAPAGVTVRRATSARLKADFPDVRFHDLSQGMRKTVAWYRQALADLRAARGQEPRAPAAAG
jgi:nucleoside-diphosphate-sugar epimerase